MSKRGRGGAVGAKFRMSLALPVGAVMNCADNTGTKPGSYLFVFSKRFLLISAFFRNFLMRYWDFASGKTARRFSYA